jgi:Fe-S cluster assembly iron-binding protein IscA
VGEEDSSIKVGNLEFVYYRRFGNLLEGLKIDYVKTWFGKRLVIQSPLAGQC